MVDINTIDWNEVWKDEVHDKKKRGPFASCVERWSDRERCRKFSLMAQKGNWKRSRDRIAAMTLSPGFRVLDIGAGPGTLAIPLAGMVKHVTAIEPSEGMRECLLENIRAQGVRNITIIGKKWEEIDPSKELAPSYDVVVASYSLGVPDLKDALLKMNAVTGRYAYIFWFADLASPRKATYAEIWEELYGTVLPEERKPNIIINLLNQLGIYANVEISRVRHTRRFTSLDEAVSEEQQDLNLTTPAQIRILRRFLAEKLRSDAGGYVMDRTSRHAKIWWEKEPGPRRGFPSKRKKVPGRQLLFSGSR